MGSRKNITQLASYEWFTARKVALMSIMHSTMKDVFFRGNVPRNSARRSRGNVLLAPAGQQRRNCLRVIVSLEPEGSVYGTPPLLIQLSMWPWTTCTLPGV